jgi:hypothetical protein
MPWPPAYSGDFEKYLKEKTTASHDIHNDNNTHEKTRDSHQKKKARSGDEEKFYREYHSGYPQVYRRVARHYGLDVWSVRDLLSTARFRSQQEKMFRVLSYVTNGPSWQQPPWIAHMFYADLYGAIIASKIQTCQQLLANGAKFELPDNGVDGARYQLPPRYTKSPLTVEALEACNKSYPVALFRDSRTELLAQRVAQNASIQRVAVNSQWTLYEDRPTKFGWIVEGANISSTNELPMVFPLNQTEVAPLIRGDHSLRLRDLILVHRSSIFEIIFKI